MSIILQGSTSGSITLQEPAVAGTTVLDLPATSGTILTTASSGQSIPSAALPTGSVLQVVQGSTTTEVSSSSSTFADVGLSASITPKFSTSKVLVIVQCSGVGKTAGNTQAALRLLRDATTISNFERNGGFTNDTSFSLVASASTTELDSPATTSSTTYKVQFASTANVANVIVCGNSGGIESKSTITLMEIAA